MQYDMEEKMKSSWRSSQFEVYEADMTQLVRRHSTLESLARRYRFFAIFSALMVIAWPLIMSSLGMGPASDMALVAGGSLYFLIASAMDCSLWRRISQIDCVTMTVAEVARRSMLCRKRHLEYMMVLIPGCILLVGRMAWLFSADESILAGMAVGGVLGLAVGIVQFCKFMREYKRI